MTPDHPFAAPSSLPYELPPFDRIDADSYRPAFLEGMAAQRAEIEAIASAPATFDTTVLGLERCGRLLERVASVFFNLAQADGSQPMLRLETEIAPLLAAHRDAIHLHPRLFEGLELLYAGRAQLGLDPESAQLLERYHVTFVRAGAQLAEADKARLRTLNRQLAVLRTQFRQNVLKATREAAVLVDRVELLEGLPAAQIGAAAAAAAARALPGRWLIELQHTTTQPALAQLHDRALRERIYRASVSRAQGGSCDNAAIIAQLVCLRAERARLLGFATHAAYALADENAGSPAAVERMLQQVAPAALASAQRRAADLQRAIEGEAAAAADEPFTLQPWDWQYYAERARRAAFAFDGASVRVYFELERVIRDGLFHVAAQLYGLQFQPRAELSVYHPDVRIYEVFDADGAPLALFLTDYYARDTKQGGAWMSNFVTQSRLLGQRAVVINCLNLVKPPPGEPTLLSFEELTTLFHEFGHALHGMLSNVRYPLLSGTSVPRDFVEFPSQFHEMWARDPGTLAHCARHYHTGEPLPAALLERMVAAQNFDQGYLTTEYLQAALIDQAWHQLGIHEAAPAGEAQLAPADDAAPPGESSQADDAAPADQVRDFESAALRRAGLGAVPIPPRYHSPYFLHIFADDYSAGYYAYLWSEVLARDTGVWFQTHGGVSRANGERLRSLILSRGWTQDTQALFRSFYGGPPDIAPLLQYRGLTEL